MSTSDELIAVEGSLILAKYRILHEIGRGGMGLVYLAEDIRLGRQVALKELIISRTLQGREREAVISRFQREARTMSTLSHPNIVTIFDIGEDQRRHFIAMEYLAGNSLKHLLDEAHEFRLEEVLDIIIQVASALDHAHSKGIIHRDIKPDNIRVLPDQNVKIMDFGIAGIETRRSGLTQEGTILGTIAYISPEQLYNSKNVSTRADLFSIGVVLYELFTRRLPFDGETLGATIVKVLNDEPERPRDYNPLIPFKIEQIILRCLEKNPLDRFASAQDLLKELLALKLSLSQRELHELILPAEMVKEPQMSRQNTYLAPFRITALHTGRLKMGKYKLLYLDDDLHRAALFSEFSRRRSIPLDWYHATSLGQAHHLLEQHEFDFMISESLFSDGKACDIRRSFPQIPMIALTEVDHPREIIALMKMGILDYLLKTDPEEDFKQVIQVIQDKSGDPRFGGALENLEYEQGVPEAAAQTFAQKRQGLFFRGVFGAYGHEPGQFASPRGIHACPVTGALLVADTQNSRVQVLDKQGRCFRQMTYPGMNAPCAVTTDAQGRIYVLDALDACVRVFSADTDFCFLFGGKGTLPGQMTSAFGITYFHDNIYVTDPEAHCLHVFNAQGLFLAQYPSQTLGLKSPSGVCAHESSLYFLDHGTSRLHVLDQEGYALGSYGKRGSGLGDLSIPKGIAIHPQGFLLMTEALTHRIQAFDSAFRWRCAAGYKGNAPGLFNNPDALTIDLQGRIYVLDRGNHRVQVLELR
jgi:serine/threonine protein kinase/sugar lactone lactonase YvrE